MRLACALLLAIAAVAPAACGDDEGDSTETVTVEQTVTSEQGTGAEEGGDGGAATQAEGPQGPQGPQHFSTPSGNIGCYVSGDGARCDISEREWKPTPEPASCKQLDLDYGQGIELDADGAGFVCAGDTTLGASKVLPYGEVSVRGAIVCESAEDGVTCTNSGDGHGFFISRQSYRIF